MHLQKQALKYVIGVLILTAVVHIDEAGVESILIYLRAPLNLSLLRRKLQQAPEHKQLVILIELLMAQVGNQVIKINLALKIIFDLLRPLSQ